MHTELVGNPEDMRPRGRHRHIWEDNIKMDLKEIVCGRVGTRFISAQCRVLVDTMI
jgi:hypothetical protein